jgi:hypothetical protein
MKRISWSARSAAFAAALCSGVLSSLVAAQGILPFPDPPMGGDLRAAPQGKAPSFTIRALRDPDGANLDRVQVIKGWLDNRGELHDRILDVLCSDDRAVNDEGRCERPVGNTVNIPKATYTNSIGDSMLLAYWKDPDFDPDQRAFYYVRVLEIPTPRWTTYDAAFFGVDLPKDVPPTQQERAYTSPIWYTPRANRMPQAKEQPTFSPWRPI